MFSLSFIHLTCKAFESAFKFLHKIEGNYVFTWQRRMKEETRHQKKPIGFEEKTGH
jgi:hypothetical protein